MKAGQLRVGERARQRADGVRANVKFVMKTAGLPEEETASSSDTEDSEAAPQDKTPDASFWDRVKNLFS